MIRQTSRRHLHPTSLFPLLAAVLLASCGGGAPVRAPSSGGGPPPAPADPLPWVNPYVGTGGLGFGAGSLVPGPQWPNGMIRPSPDTSLGSWAPDFQHFAGYWYADTHIRGFSSTRLVGTGASDQGNVRLMPVTAISDEAVTEDGYRSPFSHENEAAEVGVYRVRLDRTGVVAELAALRRVALHRYTYPPETETPYVVVDVTASIRTGDVSEAEVLVDAPGREISGFLVQRGSLSGRYGGLPTYFVVRFAEPFVDHGTFRDGRLNPRSVSATGKSLGAYAGFPPREGSPRVRAAVAVSFISVEQARANLEAEMPAFDFQGAVDASREAWRRKLGRIEVAGGSETERRIFYTALYHAYMMPTLFTEAGGVYRGFDDAVHAAEDFTYYTDMSLWDTFRTLHPLMALVDPDRARDFVVSLIRMLEQGGDLPRWPMGKGYTGCMIGTHADSVITEAYVKGVGDFDAETAYRGMVRHATQAVPHAGRADVEHYLAHGYCATDHTSGAPSRTVEYAYDDSCIGVLAEALGHAEDARAFRARAGNYATLWDPETQFLRGRDSAGRWLEPFLPEWPFAREYVEGDAWHWLWFAPQDVPGLIELFGGAGPFTDKLHRFFRNASEMPDSFLPDVYYWHGNEPDIHAAYLFNEAGRPDLTARWVRWVLEARYRDLPDGIDGNDDGGTLSAWYVFSALGFFPLNPCDGRYQIGSPLFDEAVLHLPGGDLVVRAENNSAENLYVLSATLNGEALTVPWFHHDDIARGGELRFVMGPEPGAWGTSGACVDP